MDREVDARFEAAVIISKLERAGRFPAILFRKIRGCSFPVVINMHADLEKQYAARSLRGSDLLTVIVELATGRPTQLSPYWFEDGPIKVPGDILQEK